VLSFESIIVHFQTKVSLRERSEGSASVSEHRTDLQREVCHEIENVLKSNEVIVPLPCQPRL
jgi:hypothetical protein